MLNEPVSGYERDLFARSEARQETLLRRAYARQEQHGSQPHNQVNVPLPTAKTVPTERRSNDK